MPAGLGALTAAERFIVLHNDALASLKGTPALADLGQVEFWDNPLLTQAVFDDWIAATDPQADACFESSPISMCACPG